MIGLNKSSFMLCSFGISTEASACTCGAFISHYYASVHMRKRGIYGSVFVCADCYSCSRINEVQVYRLLVIIISWILIRGFAKIKLRSRVMPIWNAIAAF